MKILVCISHVPDTISKINFTDDSSKLDTSGLQYVINPSDEYALSKAIFFQEQQGAKVTVINVGDSSTEPTLRKALAIGADDAIRIDTLPKDSFFVAKQIAEIAKNKYDMILTGKESIDYNGFSVPAILAGLLDAHFVNYCIDITLNKNSILVTYEEEGIKEIVELKTPFVVAVQKGLIPEKDLKIPNMRGVMMARKKSLEVITPIDTISLTNFSSFETVNKKSQVKVIEVDQLANLLRNELNLN